jgi:hypothetical protein
MTGVIMTAKKSAEAAVRDCKGEKLRFMARNAPDFRCFGATEVDGYFSNAVDPAAPSHPQRQAPTNGPQPELR